ncbi:MAG: nucleoside transporter C-terminal domain-containing protein [Gemmataceae bacterium]
MSKRSAAWEIAERERLAREQAERDAWERAEAERLENERLEREAMARAEQEARERAERLARERAERERAEREERERLDRIARERQEREARIAWERAERERQERERVERETAERERQRQEWEARQREREREEWERRELVNISAEERERAWANLDRPRESRAPSGSARLPWETEPAAAPSYASNGSRYPYSNGNGNGIGHDYAPRATSPVLETPPPPRHERPERHEQHEEPEDRPARNRREHHPETPREQADEAAQSFPPTPPIYRFWIMVGIGGVVFYAYLLRWWGVPRGQALCGIAAIIGMVALFSKNLNAVNWRTIGWGLGLQVLFAMLVLKFRITGMEGLGIPDGYRPFYELFAWMAEGLGSFAEFSRRSAEFLFGSLIYSTTTDAAGRRGDVVFVFSIVPTLIFVSAFFTVLYYFGILQAIVRFFARALSYLMGTSGAETLSVLADVFMGSTEAPLVVKPYLARMTNSELLTMMVGGMATISGSLMAVYIGFGADRVALLVTSLMAAPASLYLSKLLLPETGKPETQGIIQTTVDKKHRNAIDAAASGAVDGMHMAIQVVALLIAFAALIAMSDKLLALFPSGQSLPRWLSSSSGWELVRKYAYTMIGFSFVFWALRRPFKWGCELLGFADWFDTWRKAPWKTWIGPVILGYLLFLGALDLGMRYLPEHLTLRGLFSQLFYPFAILIGVEERDALNVAYLLGTKLSTNEFVAFMDLQQMHNVLGFRSFSLATFALTGFANLAAVGIQIGGIGAMVPERRADLAKLGFQALFVGFLATLLNAAIAGVLLPAE